MHSYRKLPSRGGVRRFDKGGLVVDRPGDAHDRVVVEPRPLRVPPRDVSARNWRTGHAIEAVEVHDSLTEGTAGELVPRRKDSDRSYTNAATRGSISASRERLRLTGIR